MILNETHEVFVEMSRLLHTHRVEGIQRIQDIGLSLDQARKIWLYSVLSDLCLMAEYWSIPLTVDYGKLSNYLYQVRVEVDSNA